MHVDFLNGSKTTVSQIDAISYILESATAGKLVINGHNYNCDGAGKGTHIHTGVTSYYCIFKEDSFIQMYRTEVKLSSDSDIVTTVLQNYFDHWSADKRLMMNVGHDSTTEKVQQKTNSYLEPNFQNDQIDLVTSAGLVSEF
ncbi:MAG: hypothetical protein IPM97_01245 [Bdellovibrionaceae bacterium]|nr:hypothetical protein [Pseudobdellovibrionaceae bacterium]